MTITITEIRRNINKYLDLAKSEIIFVTKRGKVIAQLSKPESSQKLSILNQLTGIASGSKSLSLEEIKSGRLNRQ